MTTLEGFLLSKDSLITLDGFLLSNVSFMTLDGLLLKYFVPLSIDFVSVSRTDFFGSISFGTLEPELVSSSTKVALDPVSEEERGVLLLLLLDRGFREKLSKLGWFRLKVPLLDCLRIKLSLLGCFKVQRLESLALALLRTCSKANCNWHSHFDNVS